MTSLWKWCTPVFTRAQRFHPARQAWPRVSGWHTMQPRLSRNVLPRTIRDARACTTNSQLSRAGIRATADHCPPRRAATSRQPILTLDGSDRIGFHTAKWVEKSYSCTNQIRVGESRFFVVVFDALESKVAYLSIVQAGTVIVLFGNQTRPGLCDWRRGGDDVAGRGAYMVYCQTCSGGSPLLPASRRVAPCTVTRDP